MCKAIAVYPVSAFGCIKIYDINYGINDSIVWAWGDDAKTWESALVVDDDGRSYFMAGGCTVYLNECTRVAL